ncbi:MAG TPA: response regulator, partial [Myxococcota bacterium]|nr:response regulator [Myxococcota bacterium]
MKPRVLVVDDDPAMCEVLREGLSDHGYDVTTATDPAEALAQIRARDWEAVVTDLNMPGQTGISLCQACSSIRPELPVILITAFGTLATAIAAIRAGAWDFVTKPLDPDALALSLGRACEVRGLRRDLRILRADVREGGRMGEMLGQSPAMKEVFTLLERVCAQDITVLVGGETGTGKEAAAESIHLEGA